MYAIAAEAGRLGVINWGPAPGDPDFWRRVLTDPNIFWLAVLNGLVGSMAAFGTDHDLMQRLLTVETRKQSQRTLILTPLGTLATLAIYLSIGAGLFAYYAQHPTPGLPRPDEIFPFFVRTAMPEVLRGLMLTAIVLASIDSPLGSLSASFVTDIYRPLLVRGRSERTTCSSPASRWWPSGWSSPRWRGGSRRATRSCGWPSRSRASPSARCWGSSSSGSSPALARRSRQRGGHGDHGPGEPRSPGARRRAG